MRSSISPDMAVADANLTGLGAIRRAYSCARAPPTMHPAGKKGGLNRGFQAGGNAASHWGKRA